MHDNHGDRGDRHCTGITRDFKINLLKRCATCVSGFSAQNSPHPQFNVTAP